MDSLNSSPFDKDKTMSHQTCGRVTKIVVIGPMVGVGEYVAVDALYQPHMPVKWSAKKVWKIDDPLRSQGDSRDATLSRHNRSSSRVSDRSENRHSDRPRRPEERKRDDAREDRKQTSNRVPSPSSKRRRDSPAGDDHRDRSEKAHIVSSRVGRIIKHNLASVELRVPDLEERVCSMLPPVDLYRVISHAQESLPLLRSLQPLKSSLYQIVTHDNASADCQLGNKSEGLDGFFVNVLLLSMPSFVELQKKVTDGYKDKSDRLPERLIRLVCGATSKHSLTPIGGAWDSDLDGPDPASRPDTQIRTAIRVCKKMVGLDLSQCTTWHRFLEFRYSRTEGSTARPASILFPGSELWGNGYVSTSANTATSSSSTNQTTDTNSSLTSGSNVAAGCSVKPYHRTCVYLLPDVTSLMPSDADWPKVKEELESTLSALQGQTSTVIFPPPIQLSQSPAAPTTGSQENQTEAGTNQNNSTIDATIAAGTTSDNVVTSGGEGAAGSQEATKIDERDKSDSTNDSKGQKTASADQNASQQPTDDQVASSAANSEEQDKSATSPSPSVTQNESRVSTPASNLPPKKPYTELNLSSMKVSELREQLKAREMATDGIKAQLVSRMRTALDQEKEEDEKAIAAAKAEAEAEKAKELLKATNEQQATATVSTASESTADDKMQSTPSTTATITAKPSAAPVTLRNYPSIVVQQLAKPKSTTGKSSNRANDQLRLHSSDLDTIFAASKQGADFETYELALCAQTLLDLIRRDAIFILFRSLVTAGDRGVHTKASHRYGDLMYHSVTPVDLPLLFACVLLDGDGKNFFSRNEVEEMVRSLGLPISRYQIRSLLAKVADGRRVYYRCLTHSDKRHQQHHQSSDSDTSTSTATSKPSGDQQQPTVTSVQQAAYSEIDDDEYLLELVRGGDAVLPAPMEDDRASTIPSGSILVLHQDRKGSSDNDTVELIQVSGGDGPTDDNLVDLTNQVRKFEDEKNKLRGQLVKKEADIAALNKSLDKMADLKTKLSDANHQVDSYRRRLRRYKDEASTLDRQLESQAAILDSCRSVIRQSAKSLRQPAESQWSAGGSGTSSSSMKRSLRSISPESSSGDAKRVKESVKKEEEHAEKSKIEVPQNGTDESSVDNSVPMIVDQ